MKEKILEILQSIREDIDFENEEYLIDDERLDSIDVVGIATELMESFGIDIDADDIEPENFNSLERIVDMVRRKIAY